MSARLIKLFLSVLLLQFAGSPAIAQIAPSGGHALPQMSVDLNALDYPRVAQSAGVQGRVLVAFNISKRGRADNEEVVESEPSGEFDSVALKAVRQVRFTVPDDWKDSGGTEQLFHISVLFKLYPCKAPDCLSPKQHDTADDFLVVGAQAK